MKNKLKKLLQPTKFIAGLILLTGLYSCGGSGEKETQKQLIGTEDNVDLTLAPVEYTTAYQAIERAFDTLTINSMSLFPIAEVIKLEHLTAFRALAVEQHNSNTTCTNYIPAIKIYFAINPNHQDTIHLIYQPVSLCRKSGSAPYYTYTVTIPNSTYYEYSPSTGFQNVSNVNDYLNKYQADIGIKRSTSSLSRTFQVTTDSTGDVASMIYPFEEIAMVLSENNNDSTLKLWNYVNNIYVLNQNKTYTKHGLFLSPGSFIYKLEGEQLTNAVPFKGNFANHPHLCPPACAEFTFKIK